MPQKKNPDIAELTRGKTGRLYGNLVAVLTLIKGLPSSYNRDLQEDKEPLFDSVDTASSALRVFAAMLPALTINDARMAAAASDPNLLATDIAEYLVQRGMPFRDAHKAVAELAAQAVETGTPLDKLCGSSPIFSSDVAHLFDPRESLRRRTAVGAPSPENVRAQIARWRELLAC
jgi:argininosuccinate lyase